MSMPYPGQRLPPVNENRDRQEAISKASAAQAALDHAARIAKQRQQAMGAEHTPGSGVMTPNSLNRAPAWEGVINPRGIDPHAMTPPPASAATPPRSGFMGLISGNQQVTSGTPLSKGFVDTFGHSGDMLAGQRSPAEKAIMSDPNDWRGKVGLGTDAQGHSLAPPMTNITGEANKGMLIPDTGYNYKGEKSYIDPHAIGEAGSGHGQVYEVDPSKDQRFSVNGQTSGAQTAAGISAKYQVPGTIAKFTPGTVTDASGATMAQNGQVTPAPASHQSGFGSAEEATAARTALLQAHPEIGQSGTAENQAFVAHAQQYGEPSAHQNVASIVAGGTALNPTADNAATAIPSGFATTPSSPQSVAPTATTAEARPTKPLNTSGPLQPF